MAMSIMTMRSGRTPIVAVRSSNVFRGNCHKMLDMSRRSMRSRRSRQCKLPSPKAMFEDQCVEEYSLLQQKKQEEQQKPFTSTKNECWMENEGVITSLEIRNHGPRGRGLFSTKAAAPGEVVLSIPLRYALAVRGDRNSVKEVELEDSRVLQMQETWEAANAPIPATVKMVANFGVLEEKWRLAVYLLWATRLGGPVWTQHGDALPSGASCPALMTWSTSELAELQDDELQTCIETTVAQTTTSFNDFLGAWEQGPELAEAMGNPTAEDFVWALAMVRSRGLGDTIGDEHAAMIVPWADMANHAFNPICSGAVNKAGSQFELDVFDDAGLPAKTEATVSYGEMQCNQTLMEKYGFWVPMNPNDVIEFSELESKPIVSDMTGRLQPLLASLPFGDADSALDLVQEAGHAQKLALLINGKLGAYHTTAAEDNELLHSLEQAGDQQRLISAVGYRLERKRLLLNASEFLVTYAAVCQQTLASSKS